MAKAKYWIKVRSLYQNSPDFFIGEYDTPEEATAEIHEAINKGNSEIIYLARKDSQYSTGEHTISSTGRGLDLKEAIHVVVLNTTQAKEHGLNRDPENSNIIEVMPCNHSELSAIVNNTEEPY